MSKPALPARWPAYVLLLINTVCWGAALVITKPAFDTTTPFRFLFYRFLMAGILSIPLLLYYLPRVKNLWPTLKKIVGLELLAIVTLSVLYTGLVYTTAIEASLITTTTPLFVTVLGFFVLKEKIEKNERAGLAIAFISTLALTIIPALAYMNGLRTFSLMGNLLILTQNCTHAVYLVLAKTRYQGVPKLFVAAVSFYLGMAAFFILSLLEVSFDLSVLTQAFAVDLQTPQVLFSALYMATFGSIIGLTTYIKGQEYIEVSEASLFNYLQPLVYLPLGMMFLGERFSLVQLGLMLLILIGVALAEFRFQPAKPARAPARRSSRRRSLTTSRSRS